MDVFRLVHGHHLVACVRKFLYLHKKMHCGNTADKADNGGELYRVDRTRYQTFASTSGECDGLY